MFHWTARELGTGGHFLTVITVIMSEETSILTGAWRSLVLFELGVNQK